MFVGVVVENFHKCRESQEAEEKVKRAEKRAKKMDKKRRSMQLGYDISLLGEGKGSEEDGWYCISTESGCMHSELHVLSVTCCFGTSFSVLSGVCSRFTSFFQVCEIVSETVVSEKVSCAGVGQVLWPGIFINPFYPDTSAGKLYPFPDQIQEIVLFASENN